MDGTLILAHGSKRYETEGILNSLIDKVRKKTGNELVCSAYLQFSGQNFEAGIEQLVKVGADNIRVVPLFLFDGIHVTEDIPRELEGIKAKYSGITISMSRHIGDDDRLVDIIADRMTAL